MNSFMKNPKYRYLTKVEKNFLNLCQDMGFWYDYVMDSSNTEFRELYNSIMIKLGEFKKIIPME